MLQTETQLQYPKTTGWSIFRSAVAVWRRKESAQERKIRQTEESALHQLPGDVFQLDCKVLDRAAAFGLIAMEEGWVAGGIIARLILSRMRSQAHANGAAGSDSASDQIEGLSAVDPSLPAQSLLRLREDFVKRGLIR